MSVAELAAKSLTVSDLEIDASALYLLARDDVPDEARQEAVERASPLDDRKQPSPAEPVAAGQTRDPVKLTVQRARIRR
jgi:hypothetical protein